MLKTNINILTRNYMIAVIYTIMISLILGEVHSIPTRIYQQEKLNQYSPFVSWALVIKAQKP